MYKKGAAVTSVILNQMEIGQNIRISSIVTESFTARSTKKYTLYNVILRITRNFLETRENIKISTHPFYHVNLD